MVLQWFTHTACVKACQNGGTLDLDSCMCDCLPEFGGEMCGSELAPSCSSH